MTIICIYIVYYTYILIIVTIVHKCILIIYHTALNNIVVVHIPI